MSVASLTSENAKSVELLTSLAQLNVADEGEVAAQLGLNTDEALPIREKLAKRFGVISLTQRNLTMEEATNKPTLVSRYIIVRTYCWKMRE